MLLTRLPGVTPLQACLLTRMQQAPTSLSYSLHSTSATHSTTRYQISLRALHTQPCNPDTALCEDGVHEQKPLVLLVGWLGAKDRYLKKYQLLWQDIMQYDVVSVRPSVPTLLFPPSVHYQARTFASQLHGQLSNTAGYRPLIIHVMSNGGFMLSGLILKYLYLLGNKEANVSGNVWLPNNATGVVFDSAPGHITGVVAARGILSAALAAEFEEIERDNPKVLQQLAGVFDAFLKLPYIANNVDQAYGVWQTIEPTTVPQLYLYSTADPIIPVQHVEEHIQQQVARGVPVIAENFIDSPHCEHYRAYPEWYLALIKEFCIQLSLPA